VIAVARGQAGADRLLPLGAESGGLAEDFGSVGGQVKQPGPAVGRVWPALEHALPFEVVDERNHRAGLDPQPLGHRLVRLAAAGLAHSPEQREMARLQPEGANELAEAA
jgi:hypothetical protein